MNAFYHNNLAHLQYVLVERDWVYPSWSAPIFDGKVWLLVDEQSASASTQATLMFMNAGLGTVVGENTSGVMGPNTTNVILPNTGLLVRLDVGLMTDAHGNPLEIGGIAPDVRNFYGMDALETTLAIIEDMVPIQRSHITLDVLESNDWDWAYWEDWDWDDVDWDDPRWEEIYNDFWDWYIENFWYEYDDWYWEPQDWEWDWDFPIWEDHGLLAAAWGNEIDLTDHPMTGNWAWDHNDSYIYELRPDGTGIRGFYGNRYEIFWFADDGNLIIIAGTSVEYWTFTVVDGVLTIVSAQVPGLTWSYIQQ